MFLCKGNAWNADDFSSCFQQNYLQALFPLIACGISFLLLAFQLIRAVSQSRNSHTYDPLKDDQWRRGRIDTAEDEEVDYSITSSESSDEELTLGRTRSHAGTSIMAVDRPRGELLISVVEEVAVLADLGLQIAFLIHSFGNKGTPGSIVSVVVWGYIAVLTSLRLLFSTSTKYSFTKLWNHTASLYGAQWVFVVMVFRSHILYPRDQFTQALACTHFALVTVLLAIALGSRKGNRAVELEYDGDIEPSREPLASVFSLMTYSWVDPIVWQGYQKPTEMSDVWNLIPKDKAAAILADYRQVKKTTILAWHLLKYFKRQFMIQAAWAVISGLITFVPTLLLKAILEYVEDPTSVPKNAAWLYVILLFVSGCINAVSSGQALWVGRRVCIRIRAIIIGEIYAKALRRRAAAGGDKVLGGDVTKKKSNDDDESEQTLLQKIMSFGRKKKSDDKKKDEETESADDSQVSSGAIINLMAVDSFKVAELSAYLHFLWAETPVQFILSIVLLYQILGNSSIVGIGMMAFLLPVNMVIAKRFSTVQKQILAATDARIHTTNEVLTNIRIIKYFAWEQRFLGSVEEKRAVELKYLRNRYIVWAIAATVWSGAPIVITFLTFLFYTLVEKKELVPSIAFTALSLFSLLRLPLDQLADMVAHVQESKVSVDRVEEYLNEPETDKYRQLETDELDDNGDPVIGFQSGTFGWGSGDSDDFKMIDLNFFFKVGQLNVITGPTGSGKTSLLMALLGEMTKLEGSVYLPGGRSRESLRPDPETGLTESVAYCAQQAWLVNGTIKDNIVFASKFNAKRYKNVIIACSLQRDLEILDAGDQTLVGEKGVTLSGGQKQRISLARALYSNARHLLMDDVLSAVDAHTAKWIFEKGLMGPLMYHRTCILVTHNAVLCLPQAEFAVVMDNGRAVAQGTAAEVIASGKLAEDLSKFPSRPPSRAGSTLPSRVPSHIGVDDVPNGQLTEEAELSYDEPNGDPLTAVMSMDIPGMNKIVESKVQQETKAEGAVSIKIIFMYLKYMGGPFYWVIAASCFILQQISQVSTNLWIREWANAYQTNEAISTMDVHKSSPVTSVRGSIGSSFNCLRSGSCIWNLPLSSQPSSDNVWITLYEQAVDAKYYLAVYAVLGFLYMLITFLREGILFSGSLTASKRIHRTLMERVTHAKLRFFDSTPLGQIMNRFSKDVEAADQEIAPVAVGVVHCFASIVTIVVLISVITPGFLIAGFFITILYFLIGKFYINSSRDLKRLESVQRSPLYQQFGETLSGMTTIRAYGDERRFIRENLQKINTHSRPFLYLWGANRWLALRVDIVGALVAFFSGVFVVLSVGHIDAGAAGLAMTYAVTFTENVLWFVRLYASNEQNMNAVERIKEYLDVDQEAAQIIPDSRPESNWPSKGSVEFIDYSTRYREDFDFVLRKINFKVLPGEKVGVVGRTGAGKSSLALALFRALEAEEGKILIDDIDIGLIGLQDLRENIVMVPQDPTLFTGTIRSNLDPFGLFTDEDIFEALRRVQLVDATSGMNSAAQSRPQTPVPTINLISSTPPAKSVLTQAMSKPNAPVDDSPAQSVSSTAFLENRNMFKNLSSPVAESGSNLSQGQRQLLCLARAMLKDPKILLMDEATASIDYATDSKIQETIRDIKNTTITIAHRLQTIVDYDKVLVLDKGEVVEFGDPFDLIGKDAGIFRGMCEMSGDFDVLEREAKKAHDARKLVDDE